MFHSKIKSVKRSKHLTLLPSQVTHSLIKDAVKAAEGEGDTDLADYLKLLKIDFELDVHGGLSEYQESQ